jgi:hypothetical protein
MHQRYSEAEEGCGPPEAGYFDQPQTAWMAGCGMGFQAHAVIRIARMGKDAHATVIQPWLAHRRPTQALKY